MGRTPSFTDHVFLILVRPGSHSLPFLLMQSLGLSSLSSSLLFPFSIYIVKFVLVTLKSQLGKTIRKYFRDEWQTYSKNISSFKIHDAGTYLQ